ncbi:hypothetical protein KP12_228 [Klebsiella phage KP12]|uniref:Uncharacterized protein n=1 Tax=Klebsiella phage KP12 TaxID=2923374 RepID=A0A9E6Z0L2_9CAUD|nr:hypothetical protein KP12_228 [Klebsiella phage KP12]
MIYDDLVLIKSALKKSRSNGIYFRDPKWLQGIYIYLSQKGSLYIVYSLGTMFGGEGYRCTQINEHALPSLGHNFEIWEGSI